MIIDINSGYARTILRVYFTIVVIFIGIVGNACCSLRAQLSVVRKQHVGLDKMTGWLKGFDLLSFGWKLKTLPGGLIGLIMVLVTALSLTSDLAVAGFVKSIYVPSRCDFGTGLIINKANGSLVRPSPNGAPVYLATQAQRTSANNTGLEGIYRKINNATSFRADEKDVFGAWTCVDQGKLIFDKSYSPKGIVDALYSKGYLFTDTPGNEVTTFSTSSNSFAEPGNFDHLVLWDSSQGPQPGQSFEVRAAIDLNPQVNTDTEMWSFHCKMNATDAEYITSVMSSQLVLHGWASYLQGSVYNGAGTPAWPNSGQIIGRLLNTITMVAGGLNFLHSSPLSSSYTDTTQGCLAAQTTVPTPVITMVLALAGIALFLIGLYLYLVTFLHFALRSHEIDAHAKKQISEAPNDLVDWMVHAVRETVAGRGSKANQVKKWKFGREGYGYGLFGPDPQGQERLLSAPGDFGTEFGQINSFSRLHHAAI